MHSNNNNKRNHDSTSTPNFQQNDNILVFANSLLLLEKTVKIQAEQISKLKDQFGQLFRCADCAVNQQQPPQSRVNRHGSHRMQPYYNPHLQTRQPAPPAAQSTDQFGLTEQSSFHQYTHTLRPPQHIPSDTQCIDQFDFIHQHNLCLSQQQQQPSALCMKLAHHHTRLPLSSQQQDTSQFESSYYIPSPKQQPSVPSTADKYGLMSEQDQHHYHTHTLQSPLPHNPSATRTTDQLGLLNGSPQQTAPPNQFGLTAGQTSPYYDDTHTLRSPLPKQQPVLLTESTDQFGHLTVGQIPNSQQLNSHMICGEKYPFPSEFDDSDGTQKNT